MKVLCINSHFTTEQRNRPSFKFMKNPPQEGKSYTVIGQSVYDGVVCFTLRELDNLVPGGRQITFRADRFLQIREEFIPAIAFLGHLTSN